MQAPITTHNLATEILSSCNRALAAVDIKRLAQWEELGLTLQQIRFLYLVAQHENACAGELALEMHAHPATITGLVDRLEGIGLVTRTVDAGDRRVRRVCLTDRGHEVLSVDGVTADKLRDAFQELCDGQGDSLPVVLDAIPRSLAT